MVSNTIRERVFDFLKDFPPFSLIQSSRLLEVAATVQVQFVEAGQYVFEEGDAPKACFFVVKQGSVELIRMQDGQQKLIDEADEGDVFGVRAMIAEQPYISSARTREETLLYGIPTQVFKPILEENSRVALYFAAGFAAGQPVVRTNLLDTNLGRMNLAHPLEKNGVVAITEAINIREGRPLVSCHPEMPIRDAAALMSRENVGSLVVVNVDMHPLGILTDTDFRRKVVTGHHAITEPVSTIMNTPVYTIGPGRPYAEIIMVMMRHKVHHLCITTDGSSDSRAVGVVSEHDLLLQQNNNPAVLLREIQKIRGVNHLPGIRDRAQHLLHDYLEQEVAIHFIAGVISELNDAIIVKALQWAEETLADEGIPSPNLRYCWLSLGSEGREEQLLRTDQDNALIYEEPNAAQKEVAVNYFQKLATYANQVLLDCGFAKCPADMMAQNPQWNQPVGVWKEYFRKWIYQPDAKSLMMATIFFDFRPVYGDRNLARQLTDYIYEEIGKEKLFLNYLAKNALLNPPPLGFFRNFVVEKSGEHKNEFDIKLRAMMPLVDAARVLVLSHQLSDINNTFRRFEKLAEIEPKKATLYREAAMAYEIMMRYRALSGLRNNDSGRFVNIEKLNKIERQTLRNGFIPISDLQEILKIRFQLDHFRG